jgi:hypothetical protein
MTQAAAAFLAYLDGLRIDRDDFGMRSTVDVADLSERFYRTVQAVEDEADPRFTWNGSPVPPSRAAYLWTAISKGEALMLVERAKDSALTRADFERDDPRTTYVARLEGNASAALDVADEWRARAFAAEARLRRALAILRDVAAVSVDTKLYALEREIDP